MSWIKRHGQVYTPTYIVKKMLDEVGYFGNILEQHIIDNSAGDGQFLKEIVYRYIAESLKQKKSKEWIKEGLETYIHGIEIQESEYKKLLFNLSEICSSFEIENVHWDIKNKDAMDVLNFNEKMDFVVGNPPYVRVHNLVEMEKAKKFNFSQGGMTDLYLVFFEISLNMLKQSGKMALITPSSWLNSKAGSSLREYICNTKSLKKIIDYGHEQLFDGITTFVCISIFEKNQTFSYIQHNDEMVPYSDLRKEQFILGTKEERENFYKIEDFFSFSSKFLEVKNGYATLADKIFIKDQFDFNEEVIRPVFKGSQGKWKEMIYPYDENSKLIEIERIAQKCPKTFQWIKEHKEGLVNRSIENKEIYWQFGRTQGINDTFKKKISVNTIIKDINSLKIEEIPAGSGVYSGIYILSDLRMKTIKNWLETEMFINYVKMLRKYKSGGYYTFSTKDLKKFLIYYAHQEGGSDDE